MRAKSTIRTFPILKVIAGGLAASGLVVAAADAKEWPRRVDASYDILVSDIKLGKFEFHSELSGDRYKMVSNAKFSIFFGAFKWRGATQASGRVVGTDPSPARYSFKSTRKKKRKSIEMSLSGRRVTGVTAVPPVRPSTRRVPLEDSHLVDVVDPMTAIMLLTAPFETGQAKDPCKQRVAIFDGKHRFDIRLFPKGSKAVSIRTAIGFTKRARICRVSYVPIAGHKKSKSNNFMARTKDIEVWMIRSGRAGLFMPYRVVVPTIAGRAVLQATAIRIQLSDNRKVALAN